MIGWEKRSGVRVESNVGSNTGKLHTDTIEDERVVWRRPIG
jgi:hypothetical protein